MSGESIEKSLEISADTLKLLQNKLVIERDRLNLPADFDELILKQYVINQSIKIFKEFLSNDEFEYFWKEAKRKLINFLKELSPTPETNFSDFIKLQVELLNWTEKHNLRKNWLLRYAYFFLFQFSTNTLSR